MMLMTAIVLLFVSGCDGRIEFKKCDADGFTCKNVSDKYEVSFDCSATQQLKEMHFWIWEINSTSINTLQIRNCKNLELDLQCKRDSEFKIQTLIIENVTDLSFFDMGPYRYPENLLMQNVHIKNIPKEVFTYSECDLSRTDMETLTIRRSKIGCIQSDAISLTNILSLVIENNTIDLIESKGVQLNAKKNSKRIIIQGNHINNLHTNAIEINGREVQIMGNRLKNVNYNALKGNVTKFAFYNNTIDVVHHDGFHVTSENIHIHANHFKLVKGGAFQQFRSPYLTSAKDPLKPRFNFSYNFIEYAEANSLYPDLQTYGNITASIHFANNTLPCTCYDVAWLGYFHGITHLYWKLRIFYDVLTHRKSRNICAFLPCTVPVNYFRRVALDGNCTKFLTEENICHFLVSNFL